MTGRHTFVFLDLAGFTAMTEAHGDEHAADVAEAFIDGVRALLDSHEACEVKTMGDAVMAHSRSAERALCLAECAVGELGGRHGALGVRAGAHTGPAVRRRGDWFGATVNVAARVAAQAAADELLVTQAAVDAAPSFAAAHDLEALGPRRLRNVGEPVVLHRLARRGDVELAIDPVCRMAVALDAPTVIAHGGAALRFCSAHCAATFARRPEVYATRQGS